MAPATFQNRGIFNDANLCQASRVDQEPRPTTGDVRKLAIYYGQPNVQVPMLVNIANSTLLASDRFVVCRRLAVLVEVTAFKC